MKTAFFLLLAVISSLDSIWRWRQSAFHLGTFLMYCITAALWIYTFFHKPIDLWCSSGVGRIFKIIFWIGVGITVALMAFLHWSGSRVPPDGTEKAIIVLGASVKNNAVSPVLAYRLDAAYDYAIQNPEAFIVVSGGQGADETIPEAQAMAEYLIQKGIPSRRILKEDKSQSTQENFLFSKELLSQNGVASADPIVFVTNRFHCYRAEGYAKRAGFENVRCIPAAIGPRSVLPSYLREVFAVLYFWCFA